MLNRHVVEQVVPLMSSRDFLFDVDLLVTARRLGYEVVEVPTLWFDQPGSTVRVGHDSLAHVRRSDEPVASAIG